MEWSSMALTKESHYQDLSKCFALWNSFTLQAARNTGLRKAGPRPVRSANL